MSNWHEMSDTKKAIVLAEKLGWHRCKDGGDFWETDETIICKISEFDPIDDWDSIGLVVGAMAEKGWGLNLDISPNLTRARYSHAAPLRSYKAHAGSVPAAVAEAAWKALKAEEVPDAAPD